MLHAPWDKFVDHERAQKRRIVKEKFSHRQFLISGTAFRNTILSFLVSTANDLTQTTLTNELHRNEEHRDN